MKIEQGTVLVRDHSRYAPATRPLMSGDSHLFSGALRAITFDLGKTMTQANP